MIEYTLNSSAREITEAMSDGKKAKVFSMFFPENFTALIPEDMYDCPVADVSEKVKMPWGAPFISRDMARAANLTNEIVEEKAWELVPLWVESSPDYIPDPDAGGKEQVCLIVPSNPEAGSKPAVIICPGGGYEILGPDNEGLNLAKKMAENGYVAFVLLYRRKPDYYPAPQEDLALAAKYVKYNAEKYGVDKNTIMFMGSSAGGHLCASVAAYPDETDAALIAELEKTDPEKAKKYREIPIKPDQLCLNYPVISFVKEAHEQSFQALTGGDESLRDKLSIELHVDENYPKTFVWACEDDGLVLCSNAVRFGEALKKEGVPCRLRVYPQGDHGCGLGDGTSAAGWSDEMLSFFNGR